MPELVLYIRRLLAKQFLGTVLDIIDIKIYNHLGSLIVGIVAAAKVNSLMQELREIPHPASLVVLGHSRLGVTVGSS